MIWRTLACLMLIGQLAMAQGLFLKGDNGGLPTMFSGSAIACEDMNGDGLEDLVVLNYGVELRVLYQRPDGRGFVVDNAGYQAIRPQWSMVVGDMDGSGGKDVFLMGNYDDIKRITKRQGVWQNSRIDAPDLYAQGANLVDINRDGYLDLFVCHDEGESHVYRNDGSGQLIREREWVDMKTVEPSDNSGNYGSVWTDLDGNGWPDLYIAKCKAGAIVPTDPRRINVMYMQGDSLEFDERAVEMGISDGSQSWAADFADVDNDGDLDVFVANHKGPSLLFIQESPGVFVDRSEEWGLDVAFSIIQVKFADLDNDGRLDLVLSGSEQRLFMNTGDRFELADDFLQASPMTSFVLGDFNEDGYLDIYASYCDLINLPSYRPDVLWWNRGGRNGYIRIDLDGQISNKDGIGATIHMYTNDGSVQMREVRAGESYGIQSSSISHFGIPEGVGIDSVHVQWPSGVSQTIEGMAINQRHVIVENGCSYQPEEIISSRDYICNGESVDLTAPEGEGHVWSTGEMGASIVASKEGFYTVDYINNGCSQRSEAVYLRENPDEPAEIKAVPDNSLCEGEMIELIASEGATHLWLPDSLNGRSILVDQPGMYEVLIAPFCTQPQSATIEITSSPTSLAPEGEPIVLQKPGEVMLEAEGETILWYVQPDDLYAFRTGSPIRGPHVERDTVFYASNIEFTTVGIVSGGEVAQKGTNKLSANSINSGIYFTVQKYCTLKSIDVYTDEPGVREIQVFGPGVLPMFSKTVDLVKGKNTIPFDLTLYPSNGRYEITTNGIINIREFGFASPLLHRSNEEVLFPYNVEDVITLVSTKHGTRQYYYFYNWQLEELTGCESERVPVEVRVLTSLTGHDQNETNSLRAYPNPSSGSLNLQWEGAYLGDEVMMEVMDIRCRLIERQTFHAAMGTFNTELNGLSPGVYFVRLIGSKGQTRWVKWVRL